MYRPLQVGIMSSQKSHVHYTETAPAQTLTQFVFYSWELVSTQTNAPVFTYVVLPDACIDIIFDLTPAKNAEHMFIMRSQKEAERIVLGSTFHYVGLRLLPGSIREASHAVQQHPATQETWQHLLRAANAGERHKILMRYIETLYNAGLVTRNLIMQRILQETNAETKVHDLEIISGYSSRQLRRLFAKELGLSPRDFLKIIRFQASLGQGPHWYTDQSHLIKEYRRITGITPKVFLDTF